MRRVLATIGGIAALAAPAASYAGAVVSFDRPPDQRPGEVKRYWTPQRMAAATAIQATVRAGGTLRVGPASPERNHPIPFTSGPVLVPLLSGASAHGKLFTRVKGLDYECSATSVNSLNRSVILTAGHCVYQRGKGFARRLAFVPAYGNHLRPLGTWVYDRVFVAREWFQREDHDYDLAAIVAEPEGGRAVNDVAGAVPMVANYAPDQQTYAAFGYPANFADAQQLWRCGSAYGGVDPNARPSGPQPIAIGCDMGDGSSGGGWILAGGGIGSLTAFSYDRHPDVLYGPYFGERAEALFHKAERADPNEPEFDKNRFAACVMESSGCSHRFVAGDLPTLRFEDRRESHTAYRACVNGPDGRSCGDGRTGRRGRSDYLIYQSATVGRYVASWWVDGVKVKHWAFRILPESE